MAAHNNIGRPAHIAARFLCAAAISAVLVSGALGQNIRIRLADFDFLRYPLINASLCVTDTSGNPVAVDTAAVTVKRNGLSIPFDLSCLPVGSSLSIVQVLDNSGSMAGAMANLRQASALLIDSMRAGDEMALLAFSSDTKLLQDFSRNKPALKNALATMFANGATALYDALGEASTMLAGRSGRRVIILISDGDDNSSGLTIDETIALAKSNGVIIYAVGLGAGSAPEQALIRIATETGGRYFRGASSADLARIYEELARHLYSGCCDIEFAMPSCADSTLSRFRVEYRSGSGVATFDTLFALPWRPDTLRLAVGPGGRLLPGQYRDVHFRLSPSLSPQLPITFNIDVRYNPVLLKLDPPYAITIGTMSQGKNISTSLLAPGQALISASAFYPAALNGSLFYLRFLALAADSSRKVPVAVASAQFAQGCANTILSAPDTIEVCQCVKLLPVRVEPGPRIVTGTEYRMPVRIDGAALERNFIVGGSIAFNPAILRPLGIATGAGDPVPWRIVRDSVILIDESWRRSQPNDSILFIVTWEVRRDRNTGTSPIEIPRIELWSDCCYAADSVFLANILVEGICDRIALRNDGITLNPLYPNPANPSAEVSFDVNLPQTGGTTRIRILLFNTSGAHVALIAEGDYARGQFRIPIDLSRLPAGKYFLRLEGNGIIRTRSFVVLK